MHRNVLVSSLTTPLVTLYCSRMDRERGCNRLIFSDEVAAVGRHLKTKNRMAFDVFTHLVVRLPPHLYRSDARARRRYGRGSPSSRAVSKEPKIDVALRFFGGISHHDVCGTHKFEPGLYYVIVKRVVASINNEMQLGADMASDAGQDSLAATFVDTMPLSPLLPWVVGALDGSEVRILAPSHAETAPPSEYYRCKGFFSLNVQTTCDRRCRFQLMSTAAPGTMHDSAAWARTQLEDILERGAIRISRRCII